MKNLKTRVEEKLSEESVKERTEARIERIVKRMKRTFSRKLKVTEDWRPKSSSIIRDSNP